MITFFLLLWLIPIGINIYIDRNGDKPNYLAVFFVRGMAAVMHAALFGPAVLGEYFVIVVFQVTSYWILFDAGLNLVRGRPLLYYDNKELDSGWVDKFFSWAGPGPHRLAKLFALALCILSVIVIYYQFG